MLKNYLTIGWRNLIRTKGFSLINISGLSTGMAITILIGLWVYNEISYNKSFANYDHVAKVYHDITFGDEKLTIDDLPAPIGEALKSNYPEFENVAILSWPVEYFIANGESTISKTGIFADSAFIDMFSLRIVEGTGRLKEIRSVLISETLAASFLGSEPLGKIIKFENRDELMVAGIFEDFPSNSEFANVKFILPMSYYTSISEDNRKQLSDWERYAFQCFVQLKPSASLSLVESKIKKLLFSHSSEDGRSMKPEAILFPMKKWHLYEAFNGGDGVMTGGQIRLVFMVGTIGLFVFLLAAINFINLSTARSEKRSKEVGIRKVMGSAHKQLIFQFLTESFLIVIISSLIALFMTALLLPMFNELADKQIVIPWTNPVFLFLILSFVVFTSLLAGGYPAFYLSSFSPARVLKGPVKIGKFSSLPRKLMVIFQFTTSIVLIVATIIVYQQIQYAKERPTGFDREGIIHIKVRTEDLAKADYNSVRNELLSSGAVDDMAISDFPITGSAAADASLTWEGKDPNSRSLVAMNGCSHDFPKTNGFQFVQGRDFSTGLASDSSAVIVNELAAKLMFQGNAVGKKVKFGYEKEREIIGVVKNQIRSSAFAKQMPQLYYNSYASVGFITIRLNPQIDIHKSLKVVEGVIKQFDPRAPFEYKFLSDDYAHQFQFEERISKLSTLFSSLAVLISCIGIFGLAAFASSQRTKEIGIRKVLGASNFSIWKLLSNDFIRLVVVSIIIGSPIAFYLTSLWLEQYDYRIKISWFVFLITAIATLLITLVTVSYQAITAAMSDPVKSIRTE